MERKRVGMTRNEEQLSSQIAQLKKENDDLKARKLQANAQIKQLQTKLAAVEATSNESAANVKDANEEVEHARKSCREYQFRIKQLQEELVFQEKRKRNGSSNNEAVTTDAFTAPTAVPVAQPHDAENDDVPSWMKD